LAGAHHATGFFDERVAGVVVGETVEEACFGDEGAEFFGFREIKGCGFVGENREAVFQRGFGAMPLQQGPIMRAGLGGAFTSLAGTATIFPNPDGSLPALDEVGRNAAVLDLGLGWVQRYGTVPFRVEGRVNGFAPELANTRYTYGVQFGIGY
jgi:hypothetical protein